MRVPTWLEKFTVALAFVGTFALGVAIAYDLGQRQACDGLCQAHRAHEHAFKIHEEKLAQEQVDRLRTRNWKLYQLQTRLQQEVDWWEAYARGLGSIKERLREEGR